MILNFWDLNFYIALGSKTMYEERWTIGEEVDYPWIFNVQLFGRDFGFGRIYFNL